MAWTATVIAAKVSEDSTAVALDVQYMDSADLTTVLYETIVVVPINDTQAQAVAAVKAAGVLERNRQQQNATRAAWFAANVVGQSVNIP